MERPLQLTAVARSLFDTDERRFFGRTWESAEAPLPRGSLRSSVDVDHDFEGERQHHGDRHGERDRLEPQPDTFFVVILVAIASLIVFPLKVAIGPGLGVSYEFILEAGIILAFALLLCAALWLRFGVSIRWPVRAEAELAADAMPSR